MSFRRVYIDISGHCNAKCRWCVTCNDRHIPAERGFLSPEAFAAIVERLQKIQAVGASTEFAFHNWGEPALNKNFSKIVHILQKQGIHWLFSTNASVIANFDTIDPRFLKGMTISMPGFSQKSYDKIHGFRFKDICRNIVQYADMFGNQRGKIAISFHVYQFNLHEIDRARAFAKELSIRFSPSLAYFNNHALGRSYINKQLSYDDLHDASSQLLLFYVDDLLQSAPKDYICPQLSMLSLDEFGNVLQCCGPSRTQEHYSIGSLFDLSLDDIIHKRQQSPACIPCLDSGLAYWVHNPLRLPSS